MSRFCTAETGSEGVQRAQEDTKPVNKSLADNPAPVAILKQEYCRHCQCDVSVPHLVCSGTFAELGPFQYCGTACQTPHECRQRNKCGWSD